MYISGPRELTHDTWHVLPHSEYAFVEKYNNYFLTKEDLWNNGLAHGLLNTERSYKRQGYATFEALCKLFCEMVESRNNGRITCKSSRNSAFFSFEKKESFSQSACTWGFLRLSCTSQTYFLTALILEGAKTLWHQNWLDTAFCNFEWAISSRNAPCFRWFLSIALRIPTQHSFCAHTYTTCTENDGFF